MVFLAITLLVETDFVATTTDEAAAPEESAPDEAITAPDEASRVTLGVFD